MTEYSWWNNLEGRLASVRKPTHPLPVVSKHHMTCQSSLLSKRAESSIFPHPWQTCKAFLPNSRLHWFSFLVPTGNRILRTPRRRNKDLITKQQSVPLEADTAFPPPGPYKREPKESDGSLNTENIPNWQTPSQQSPSASCFTCKV